MNISKHRKNVSFILAFLIFFVHFYFKFFEAFFFFINDNYEKKKITESKLATSDMHKFKE